MVDNGEDAVRVRLDFGYDGSAFSGWALQPGLRTVQDELEDALAKVLRPPSAIGLERAEAGSALPASGLHLPLGADRPNPGYRLTVAGRTDAGVHARRQVAHLDVPLANWAQLPGRSDRAPATALLDRLTAVLPDDIAVNSVAIVPPGFDARFSAGSRRYAYRIADSPGARDALTSQYVLRWRRALDVGLMNEASRMLVGLHDFAAFCRPRPDATTIRRLITFAWRRPTTGPDQGLAVATIRADAFCHNMVRALVGAAIKVGEGKESVTWPSEVLLSRRRDLAAAIVPPHGLTLEEVTYPPPPFAAERALIIRAKRKLAEKS